MKNQFTKKALSGGLCLLAAAGMALQSTPAQAQVQNYVRNYATRVVGVTPLLTSISSSANAVDGDPATYSTMSVTLAALGFLTPSMYIDFNSASSTSSMATHIPAGTPMTIKVSLPASTAALIGGVSVQPIKDLHKPTLGAWTATNVGSATVKSSLLGLLSGNGSMYITVTPSSQYDGVLVTMSGVQVIADMQVYDAFTVDTINTNVDCGAPIDVLAGSNSTLNVANGISGVLNPWRAIDGDTSHYATMSAVVNVATNLYLQPVFSQPGKSGDSVRIVMRSPGGLLSASVLNNFSIVPYMGDSARTTIAGNSNLLNLRLLYTGSNKQVLTVPVGSSFNSVQIKVNGLANVLSDYHVYDVSHIIPTPQMTAAQKDIYVYAGQSANLVATTTNGDNVVWYTDSTRTTIANDTVVTTTAQAGTTISFYAAAERNGCTNASGLNRANVHVIGATQGTLTDATMFIPYTGSVALTLGTTPAAGFNTPDLYYGLIAPGTPGTSPLITGNGLPSGISMDEATGNLIGTPDTFGTFPLQVTVYDSANNLNVGTFNYNLVVNAAPLSVTWNFFRATANANHTATLNWQTANEQDNNYFEVQRSLDAKSFESIGKVASQNGSAAKNQSYSYIDQNVSANTVYYRLRQVDVNGRYSYSSVATVEFADAAGDVLNITPNPGHDMINLQFNTSAHAAQVVVSDISGRVVYKSSVNAANMQIPATSGTYYVRVLDANGQIMTTQKAIVK